LSAPGTESAPNYGKVPPNPTLFRKPEINYSRAIPLKEDGSGGWCRKWQVGKDGKRVSVVTGGYIEQYRADKYALELRVSPLCKSIVEHFLGETQSSPQGYQWCYDTTADLADRFQRSERAIELAVEEGSKKGIIEREHPGQRYNKGAYRVNCGKILEVPLRPSRQYRVKTKTASVRADRGLAALHIPKPKDPAERAKVIAEVEAKLAELRADLPASEINFAPAPPQSPTPEAPSQPFTPPAPPQSHAAEPAPQADAAEATAQVATVVCPTCGGSGRVPAQNAVERVQKDGAGDTEKGAADAQGCAPAGPILNVLTTNQEPSSSPVVGRGPQADDDDDKALAALTADLHTIDPHVGPKVTKDLLIACRRNAPDARPSVSCAEVADVCRDVLARERKIKPVTSPIGLWLNRVPAAFPNVLEELRKPAAAWRKSQGSAPPRPTEATRQQEDELRALVLEYEYFREHEAWVLFEALGSDALEARRAEKRNYLKGQGRWDRIAPDVRIREVDDLIRLDLVKRVAPFEEWLKWKREAETP
jgi:hypothetical protein